MNTIIITGRFTADPEVKMTPQAVSVLEATIAVERPFNKGQKQVDFIPVQAWRATAEFIGRNFHKGDSVLITGSMQNDRWEDKEGRKRDNWKIRVDNVEFYGKATPQEHKAEPEEPEQAAAPQEHDPYADENLPF